MEQTGKVSTPRRGITEQERDALKKRREINGLDIDQPSIGLALSGGGVRSATFCLGLLRALAKNGVLKQFDYLSTVSGGGYAGSAFGRLFTPKVSPKDVEDGLANDDSILLWWLRRNGRYLLPAGMHDVVLTWASQLRGFIATQFEVMLLLALMSCVIVLPHLSGYRWEASLLPTLTSTPWWAALPVVAWLATITAFGYWWSGDTDGKPPWGDLLICILTAVIGAYLLKTAWLLDGGWQGNVMMTVIGGILFAVPVARLSVAARRTYPATDRVRFTAGLGRWLKVMLVLVLFGASDLLSWFLADSAGTATRHGSAITGAGVTAILIAVARFALPLLHSRNDKTSRMQLPLRLIANLFGMLLVAMLALFWLSVLQYFVFVARLSALDSWMHWLAVFAPDITHLPHIDAWLRWATVAVTCTAYVVLTGSNLELLNRSSLHAFYRSRIARTYVSVGNSPDAVEPEDKHDLPRFPSSPLKSPSPGATNDVQKLTELLQGDDVELAKYAPHVFGGPIHLINCCINQTIDDRTDTYNADRKGVYLTVSSLGVESGTQLTCHPVYADPLANTTLAQWIAISGAAAGSGMGSMTRVGISALFFLSGLRLGYWWDNQRIPSDRKQSADRQPFGWKRLGKSRAALQKILAYTAC